MAEYSEQDSVGIEVPRGGSDCQKCEYLKDAQTRLCGNKKFIAWDGSKAKAVKPKGSNKIPLPIDEYCCNYFEIPDNDADDKNPLVQLKVRGPY